MASKSAERCKLWREKRKDDAGHRERERQRKRDARRKRTAEGKQHDRILGKTRQRKFRENAKKKTLSKDSDLLENVDEVNENISKVDTGNDEVNNDTENIEEIHFAGSSNTNEDIRIIIGNVDVTRHMSTRPDNVAPVQLSESNEMKLDSFSISNSKDINAFPERSIWSKMDDDDCHAILQNVNTNRPSLKENTLSITEEEPSIRDQNADRRKAYFQALQTALLRIEDFDSIKSHCSSYSQHIDKTYPIEDLPVLDGSKYLTDLAALSLYPHGDAPDSYVPIQTFGDGNCLPRVGSLFAFGNEEHHVEIRVRIFMELCRFEDTYLDNSFLNRGMSVPSDNIAIAYASYSDVFVPQEKDKCRFAYRRYVKNILKTNSFNSMWSIFALASILGVQICSIYPSYGGFNVRDHLHRQVMPRILRHNNRTIHIMWTSTQGKRNSPITWTPNHFVAVLPTQDDFPFGYGLDVAGSSSQTQTMRMQMDTHQHGSHTQEGISDGVSKIVQKDENVDSPTSALLRYAELESSTIHVTQTATGGGEGMADRSGADNYLRRDKERLDSTYETFEDKRRQGDMCSLHPTEELVYFCSTCKDLPICYKCHLQTHQRHDLTDLKVHLVDMEESYLREVSTAHEKLMRDVNQRKRAHEDDSQQIKRKIKELETCYKQQVETWTRNQTDIVNTRDKAMESKLEYFIVQSKNSEKIAKRKVSELRSLPISQRVLALGAESEQTMLTDICPRTQKITFSTEPFNILEHLGTITEIVDENSSKTAANELVQTERDCCGGSIVTNNYQQKGLRNDNGSKLPDKSIGAIGVGDYTETVSLSSHPDTNWFNGFLKMTRDIDNDLLFSSNDDYDSDASNSSDEEKVDHFKTIINRVGPTHNATDRHLVTMQTNAISDYTINHEFEKPDEVSYIKSDHGQIVRKTYRLPHDTSERRRTVCDTLYRHVTTHRQTTGKTGERITFRYMVV